MGASNTDGPFFIYGDMGYIQLNQLGPSVLPTPNIDAGPSVSYQGDGLPDLRFTFLKDKIEGYAGVVPSHLNLAYLQSNDQIPSTAGTATIAALANVTSGTAMTLVSTPATGIAINVPINPYTGELNASAVVTAPIMLDFGFAWGNCTSGSTTIVVADSTQFAVGMPLVVAHVGNAAGTAALLTNVQSITDATHIVVGPNAPQATNASTPIGAGNIWGFREGVGYPVPTAHLPYLARGPGLFLDPSQAIARTLSATGVVSGTGGTITIKGWDIYWQPMTETITVAAGVNTVKGKKAFKAILSATPNFTDAHTYSIGTSDTFGFHLRSDKWEYTNEFFNGTFATTSNGWTAADKTNPATATTGDVRGTIDVTNASGFNSASNGTVASLAMTGRRLAVFQSMPLLNIWAGSALAPTTMFGQTQF